MKPDLPLVSLYRPAVATPDDAWLVVLLHGVGSNEQDLFDLAPQLPPQFHVLSLRAPHSLGPDSFGWFTFGVRPDGRRVINREQEATSRPLVGESVRSAGEQLAVPAARTVVGGFSQGGIMALSLLLTRPELLRAAMAMHSRLLPEVLALAAPPESLRGRSLFVSHGTDDGVIPVANAREVRDRSASWPVQLSYHEFPGGHELRPAEIVAATAFLAQLAAPPAAS